MFLCGSDCDNAIQNCNTVNSRPLSVWFTGGPVDRLTGDRRHGCDSLVKASEQTLYCHTLVKGAQQTQVVRSTAEKPVARLKAVSGPPHNHGPPQPPCTRSSVGLRHTHGVRHRAAAPGPTEAKEGQIRAVAQNRSQSTSGRTTPFSSYGLGSVPGMWPRFSPSFCLPGIVTFGRAFCALSNDKCQPLWQSSELAEPECSWNGRIYPSRAKPQARSAPIAGTHAPRRSFFGLCCHRLTGAQNCSRDRRGGGFRGSGGSDELWALWAPRGPHGPAEHHRAVPERHDASLCSLRSVPPVPAVIRSDPPDTDASGNPEVVPLCSDCSVPPALQLDGSGSSCWCCACAEKSGSGGSLV